MPQEIARAMRARNAVLIREHNDRAWLAWHTGALSRPLKKFPPLDSLKIKPAAQKRQTWEQQLAIAHMLASRGLGKISRKS